MGLLVSYHAFGSSRSYLFSVNDRTLQSPRSFEISHTLCTCTLCWAWCTAHYVENDNDMYFPIRYPINYCIYRSYCKIDIFNSPCVLHHSETGINIILSMQVHIIKQHNAFKILDGFQV